jgi:hypothetical protein
VNPRFLFFQRILAREGGKMNAYLYRRPNRRKCYWLCRDCLKGHSHRCSPKCPDYLSIAKAKKQKR